MKPNVTASARQGGMTLIELMITLAIIAIVASLAVPSMGETIRKNSVNSAQKKLRASFAEARSLAVSNNSQVTICASDDRATCSGAWQNGWIIYTGTDTPAATDILSASEGLSDSIAASGDATVTFEDDGTQGKAGVLKTIKLCIGSEARYGREVYVGTSGIVRRSKDLDGDGVHNKQSTDNYGDALTCP